MMRAQESARVGAIERVGVATMRDRSRPESMRKCALSVAGSCLPWATGRGSGRAVAGRVNIREGGEDSAGFILGELCELQDHPEQTNIHVGAWDEFTYRATQGGHFTC